jgi:hypothetical protein
MNEVTTGRRDLMTIAAGVAMAGAAISATPQPARAAELGLGTPAGKLRAFMLMRGALDDRLVIGTSTGCYYGVVAAEVTPLFNFVAATFSRFRKSADGTAYEGASYEVPFFTDLATGELLQSWKNPYTGETVKVPPLGAPATRIVFTQDLQMKFPVPPPGLELNHVVTAPVVSGNDVWLVERSSATFHIPNLPVPLHFTEINTLHALVSDLAEPGVRRVPCLTAYEGIGGWRPWMNMSARPGNMIANGFGRYGVTMNGIVPGWHEIAAAQRPDAVKDPGAVLDKLLNA